MEVSGYQQLFGYQHSHNVFFCDQQKTFIQVWNMFGDKILILGELNTDFHTLCHECVMIVAAYLL